MIAVCVCVDVCVCECVWMCVCMSVGVCVCVYVQSITIVLSGDTQFNDS